MLVFLAIAPFAFAQNTQIGAVIGGGAVEEFYVFGRAPRIPILVAGVEGCVFCGGRLGLFMEYYHLRKIGEGPGHTTSWDLVSGGLRIQGKGERVRPFFDIGPLGGTKRSERNNFREDVVGLALGAGAAISVTEHWYVRPFAKIRLDSSLDSNIFAGAAVGYCF